MQQMQQVQQVQQNIKNYVKAILLLLMILSAGFCYSCDRGEVLSSLESIPAAQTVPAAELTQETAIPQEAPPTQAQIRYYVHICGEVEHPGVYEMEAGDRIYQVVERAGGYTQAAATDYLNLAEPVVDGMKLVVPDQNELAQATELYGAMGLNPERSSQGAVEAGKINLNTATKEQLMTLRGIGEARAGDIIRYRETHGNFSCIEDIMKVSGIKDAAFQKIKESITV